MGVAEVVGGRVDVPTAVVVEVGVPAVDVQGYLKPKMVHVARFWSSSLGIASTELAKANRAVVVRSFMSIAKVFEWKFE